MSVQAASTGQTNHTLSLIGTSTRQVSVTPASTSKVTPAVVRSEICPEDNCQVKTGSKTKAQTCEHFVTEPVKAFYLNGIRTPESAAKESLQGLEDKTKQDIELIYNPTEGLLSDVAESVANLSGVDTAISRKAEAKFRQALDKGEKVKIYAHSQGAAIAADALRSIAESYKKQGLSKAQIQAKMSQVEVFGFGGFAIKDSFPKGVHVELFKHDKDFIPKFAEALCDVGKAAQSKENDMMDSLGRLGQTIGDFFAVNTGQALRFMGKPPTAANGTSCPKPTNPTLLDGFNSFCKSLGTAVESDHNMLVKDDYIRENFSSGYLDTFDPQTSQASQVA